MAKLGTKELQTSILVSMKQSIVKAVLLIVLVIICAFIFLRKVESTAKNNSVLSVIRDVQYVPGSKDPFQQLDLYLPRRDGPALPVVVWIHGGAWWAGDKTPAPSGVLLRNGFAVASINYRLSQQAVFPAQINDCKAAVRWLRAHAQEYNLDPKRIAVWGHSAGGHLAALLATSSNVKELEGDGGNLSYSSAVSAAVDWAGLADLLSISEQAPVDCEIDFKSSKSPVALLMGAGLSKESYLKASPIYYASKDTPPILIVHGDKDTVVPIAQSLELSQCLSKAGAPMEYFVAEGQGHGLSQPKAMAKTVAFLKKYLQNNPLR